MRLALKGLLGSPDRRRRGLRGLLGGVLLVVTLLLLALFVMSLLLASEGVNRWFFQRLQAEVPALQIRFDEGSLWRGWHFQHLGWQTGTLTVGLDNLELRWTPACLLRQKLCLDRLHSERLLVRLGPETPPPSDEPITLPDIHLPLAIELSEVSVDSVYLLQGDLQEHPTPLLTDLQLVARSDGFDAPLVVERFSGQLAGDVIAAASSPPDPSAPQPGWLASGELQTHSGWPLQLQSRLQLPSLQEQTWAVTLQVEGSLQQLSLSLASEGYLEGVLQGWIEPISPTVPAQLQWRGEPFLAWPTLPSSLTLNDWTLQLVGDLQQGYQLQGHGQFLQLAQAEAMVNLALSGRLNANGAQQLQLDLTVAGEPERRLALSGDLNWQSPLQASSHLQLQDFPWQWFYPVATGLMEVEQLQLQAQLQDRRWQAELTSQLLAAGELTAPAAGAAKPSRWTLAAQLHGDNEGMQTDSLSLTEQQGQAEARGDLQLSWSPYPQWRARLDVEQLDPALWIKPLPGQLSGSVSSSGQYRQQALQLAANWRLDGQLRRRSTRLQGALSHDQGLWLMPELLLEQGDNRIRGQQLQLDAASQLVAGQLQLALPALDTLWPGLRGVLNGELALSGRAGAPRLQGRIDSDQLGYGDWSLQGLTFESDLSNDEQAPGEADLRIAELKVGDVDLGQLQLALSGTQSRHQASLALSGGELEWHIALQGKSDARGWQGRFSDGRLSLNLSPQESLQWRQQTDAQLNYGRASAALTLSPHCWRQGDSRLCLQQTQKLLPDRQLQLQLQDFDFSALTPLLPNGLQWQGRLNGQLQLQQPDQGELRTELALRSDDGALHRTQATEVVSFPYRTIELTAQLQAAEAQAQIHIDSELVGRLDIDALIEDPGAQQNLSGRYRLSRFKLDVLQPFLPQVSRLEGRLQGQGELSGQLRNPIIKGDLQLREGHLSGPNLPVNIDRFSADIEVLGQQARLRGQWQSGNQGRGRIEGELDWLPWHGQLRFYGEALPVSVPPYAELMISPDLTATLSDQQLEISGRVSVPTGKIQVRELPPSVVHVSPDTVIVGEEAEEPLPVGLKASIQLDIGDQLQLSAFGLSGRLKGQLLVKENMTASGEIRILNGRFKRYGQDLKLRRSLLLFSGPLDQPYLSVEAYRQVDDVLAGLRLTGRASNPSSEIFSEPAMSQQEALSYLVLGRPLDEAETDEGERSLMGEAALALGVAGSANFAGRVGEAFGISDFELDTEGSGTDTQVVVSGNLTDKLSVRYGMGVFEPANQVALRYDLTRQLYIEAISGLANSLDFFYRIDF